MYSCSVHELFVVGVFGRGKQCFSHAKVEDVAGRYGGWHHFVDDLFAGSETGCSEEEDGSRFA